MSKLSITVPVMQFDKKLGTANSPVVPTSIEYDTHPYADLFPVLEGDALTDLADDINANGQRLPIVLVEREGTDVILDGRSRFLACGKAGVNPEFVNFEDMYESGGEDQLLAFVTSANLHRRHLDASQRAMIAARLKPIYEEAAKQRMLRGTPSADPRQGGKAAEKAAEVMNVSTRLVEGAQKVLREGSPELVQAVERGDESVNGALHQIKTEPSQDPQDEDDDQAIFEGWIEEAIQANKTVLQAIPAQGTLKPEAEASLRAFISELENVASTLRERLDIQTITH
jgi:ParB-like chromosome segregation protein Spo0J